MVSAKCRIAHVPHSVAKAQADRKSSPVLFYIWKKQSGCKASHVIK